LNPEAGSGENNLRSALNKAELEALEALKLQYFQNATKFLAKGEYDSALAEIKRVLLIDPEHRLAREYEIRVTELQASRVQAPKPEPAPKKEPPRVAPAAYATVAPARVRSSRKTWLYVALIGLLLLGTAGVLTLEKVDDGEESAVAIAVPVMPVSQTAAPQVSTPADEQPAENTLVKEEPTPAVQPLTSAEPKHSPVVAEKSAPRPEPVRRDPAPAPPVRSGSAGSGLLAFAAEKKVEPPPAPVKKDVPAPQPEVKAAATQPPPSEPARESVPFVATEKEPKLLHLQKVRLPGIATRGYISAEVRAKVLVDRDGKPQKVEILSSTNSIFEQPVIDALEKSTFSPGMMGAEPVSAWLVIPFKFK